MVSEKIHTHPMEGHWKFLGGGGGSEVIILEPKYETKLEFFFGGGGGCKTKNLLWWGVWIFSGAAQFEQKKSFTLFDRVPSFAADNVNGSSLE